MKRAERRLSKQRVGAVREGADGMLAYAIALQRAIEIHCAGEVVPEEIARECPWCAHKLNEKLRAQPPEESRRESWCRVDVKYLVGITEGRAKVVPAEVFAGQPQSHATKGQGEKV